MPAEPDLHKVIAGVVIRWIEGKVIVQLLVAIAERN